MSAPLHFQTSDEWLTLLKTWAAGRPEISRLWLFGSRVTGVRRNKDEQSAQPDLDVAYELDQVREDETVDTIWAFRVSRWKDDLQAQLPVKLDLQWLARDLDEPRVERYVSEHGVLLYEKS